MKISEVRVAHARLIVVVAAIVASAAILWLARTYTFYFDEWTFITTAPDWSWRTFLEPHNEHPVMLTRAVYAVLLATVGLHSYLPYTAVNLAFHAASVVLLFEVVRRRGGDLIGLGAAALLVVIGAGWEDLLWAFQIQFIGSVACGLGMLLALQGERSRRRLMVAAALATGSLMFSSVGLFFGLAAAVLLIGTPGRRRDLIWFAPVAVALAVWFLAFGRSGTSGSNALSLGDLALLPLYVLWGLGTSAGGLIGVTGWAGFVVLVLAALAVGYGWWRGGIDPFGLGIALGLVAFYAVTGLIRVKFGYQQSGASRYTYVAAVFWLLLLADAARRLPWRGTWRPALVACLFLACFNSGVILFEFAAAKTVQMQRQIADLQALAAERSDPCLDPNGAVDPLVMPVETSPAVYYRAIDRYGDPSAGLPIVDQADFATARANLQTLGCK
jgi:hypothetical protein